MRRLELTTEDMDDLLAGKSINVPLDSGEEIIAYAPESRQAPADALQADVAREFFKELRMTVDRGEAALADEHEGNLRAAVALLHEQVTAMRDEILGW